MLSLNSDVPSKWLALGNTEAARLRSDSIGCGPFGPVIRYGRSSGTPEATGSVDYLIFLASDPPAWAALVTLITMEVVLGISNLILISVLAKKLPQSAQPSPAPWRSGGAHVLRLGLLGPSP